tara:strand:- start:1949 stop:2332 length:384 start_codon:yes stop_codon:yes gene_type:complete
MKLIDDFVKRFHDFNLPSPEKCFILEDGDEVFISKWILKGKLNGKAKDLFEWIEKKYSFDKSKSKILDQSKFDDIERRFFLKNWRIIVLLCEYQTKFRYYSKAINAIKEKSFSEMDNNEFLKLFDKK